MATAADVGAWLAQNDVAILRRVGIEYVSTEDGSAKMRLRVERDMLNSGEVCQGGFMFTLADHAFAFACMSDNQVGYTLSADITYVSPARLGDVLTAVATVLTVKGRIATCDVAITNQHDEQIALFRGLWYRTKTPVITA